MPPQSNTTRALNKTVKTPRTWTSEGPDPSILPVLQMSVRIDGVLKLTMMQSRVYLWRPHARKDFRYHRFTGLAIPFYHELLRARSGSRDRVLYSDAYKLIPLHASMVTAMSSDAIHPAILTRDGNFDELDEKPKDVSRDIKILSGFGRPAERGGVPAEYDINQLGALVDSLTVEQATSILLDTIKSHDGDPNFPMETMTKIRSLVQGAKTNDMDTAEWELELKIEAAVVHFHSPYAEVRAATDPFDDVDAPVESIRAYVLGLCLAAGSTALNTFFEPRQPGINIGTNVLQILLAIFGRLWVLVIPNWKIGRLSLNPGPWSLKEQIFATIFFNIAHDTTALMDVLFIQSLPQYLKVPWMNYGYQILLGLSTKLVGFAYAGMLRRIIIYPTEAIFPNVLPTLVLCRSLILAEKPETINGWRLSRFKFFWIFASAMFVYFWLPNTFVGILHGFNWMAWIAPDNLTLATVTGFYGGMGFNPIATFDWNVAGAGALTTPFFAQIQTYAGNIMSGIAILGIYFSNRMWAAYMPINANLAFANTGQKYNVSLVLADNGHIDQAKFDSYGPPYLPAAFVWNQGARIGWYTVTLSYIFITRGKFILRNFESMWHSFRTKKDAFDEFADPHSRMMRHYPEVPDWWYAIALLFSAGFGIAALAAWPTTVPWWSVIAIGAMTLVVFIPSALILSTTGIQIGYNVLFQVLGGLWFKGNPVANLIVTTYGQTYNNQADAYITDLKLAHYAKLPQRAVFRAQLIAATVGTIVWIGVFNWLVNVYNDGTLCNWDNKQHFVCSSVSHTYSTAIEFGAYGTVNFFKLYPFLPYISLIGLGVGTTTAVLQTYHRQIKDWLRLRLPEKAYSKLDAYLLQPFAFLRYFNPPVFWSGFWHWLGGVNLSYSTNAMYVSIIFMYYIKRRYTAWWTKYNYLLEGSFGVGIALSGLVQTLAFRFGPNVNLAWWGNTVPLAGVDYQLYNNKGSLLKLKKGERFGVSPEDYPKDF